MRFGVITEIGDGNFSCSEIVVNPDSDKCIAGSNLVVDGKFDEDLFADALRNENSKTTTIDLTKLQMLFCNVPVFRLGEILIMGSNDRTIPDGRKPSKWDVSCEYYDDIDEAIARAIEVTDH